MNSTVIYVATAVVVLNVVTAVVAAVVEFREINPIIRRWKAMNR